MIDNTLSCVLGFRATRLQLPDVAYYQSPGPRTLTPSTVRDFLMQQVWHGLGMFGTFRLGWFDKPVLATFAHLGFSSLGIFGPFVVRAPVPYRIGAFLLTQAGVPLLATAYRAALKGELYRPLRSFGLYYLYFVARSWALFKLCILGRRLGLRPQHYYHRRSGQRPAAPNHTLRHDLRSGSG